MSNCLILVPARFGSTRFPGKPLALIHEKPMISYVVANCIATGFDYAIVTDNSDIEDYVKSINGSVVRVDDDITTGSERIALAYDRFFKDQKDYEYIINVQGDEPLLNGDVIKTLVEDHKKSDFDIYTGVKKRRSSEPDFLNPNVVKCVKAQDSHQCLYFSRASIPTVRNGEEIDWFQHIGLYCYKVDALEKFVSFPVSQLESSERLEQLRALENRLTIGASELDIEIIGVDSPEDIFKIEKALK